MRDMKRLRRNEFTPQLTGYKSHSELTYGSYITNNSTNGEYIYKCMVIY